MVQLNSVLASAYRGGGVRLFSSFPLETYPAVVTSVFDAIFKNSISAQKINDYKNALAKLASYTDKDPKDNNGAGYDALQDAERKYDAILSDFRSALNGLDLKGFRNNQADATGYNIFLSGPEIAASIQGSPALRNILKIANLDISKTIGDLREEKSGTFSPYLFASNYTYLKPDLAPSLIYRLQDKWGVIDSRS